MRYTDNLKYIIGMFSSNITKLNKYKDNKSNRIDISANITNNVDDSLFSET